MNSAVLGCFALALLQICQAQDVEIVAKAPSNLINCGCQCDPYTWRDSYGNVQGNCRTPDGTKALWCYVPRGFSSCDDLRLSRNRVDFTGNRRQWSYEACSTPALTSPVCRGFSSGGNYVGPQSPSRPNRNNRRNNRRKNQGVGRPNSGYASGGSGNVRGSGNVGGGGLNLADLLKPRSEGLDPGKTTEEVKFEFQ
ncbi:uncharacterized protein LOC131884175 [Tigriopus californicus]|uniref:uncharacterized protein LOC131884175 n=1 Tax=Tigriopus californicus TaxID=6832 RepID=UPI0027DA9D26|nr:uncharacterized protein LOC131884175 [Tigriopus californicus]|eukprot:TCALIF_09976-PA protein Name:"Protein of unknown function" AED:0.26 eAED:0.26 QI:133/1/1/1/1/1/2/81/195